MLPALSVITPSSSKQTSSSSLAETRLHQGPAESAHAMNDAEEDKQTCNQQVMMQCVGVQRMVERGTEGLLAVQRQVAAVQAGADQALTQTSSELRQRLEELHQKQHCHQDLLQVNPCSLSCCITICHILRHSLTLPSASAWLTARLGI